MYQEYFGLADEPFKISPDPSYLYLTPQHKEVLGKCQYVIQQQAGLAVVHGDIGTGKTTIARRLYHSLEGEEKYEVAMMVTPDLKTDTAFLRAIMNEFNIPMQRSHAASVQAFQSYAGTTYKHGKNLVLLVDEAQQMTNRMFEVIRGMLNFEADNEKFTQIILFGQNELATKLDNPRLEAIKDRVSMFGVLHNLSLEDMTNLIAYRWTTAGGDTQPFTDEALATIHTISRGLPRKINNLCSIGLMKAMYSNEKVVTDKLVMQAALELRMSKEGK
jgi:general secretion pathway protein A